jgi:hypothetical protein
MAHDQVKHFTILAILVQNGAQLIAYVTNTSNLNILWQAWMRRDPFTANKVPRL